MSAEPALEKDIWQGLLARAKQLVRDIENNQWEFAELAYRACREEGGYGSIKRFAEEVGYTPGHISRVIKTWELYGANYIPELSFNEHMERARVINREDKQDILAERRQRHIERTQASRVRQRETAREETQELVEAERPAARLARRQHPTEEEPEFRPTTPMAVRMLRESITDLDVYLKYDRENDLYTDEVRELVDREVTNALRSLRKLHAKIKE
jgi:hypothetical protein